MAPRAWNRAPYTREPAIPDAAARVTVRKYRTHLLGAFGASSVELVAGKTLTPTASSANTVDVHVRDAGLLQIEDGLAN